MLKNTFFISLLKMLNTGDNVVLYNFYWFNSCFYLIIVISFKFYLIIFNVFNLILLFFFK